MYLDDILVTSRNPEEHLQHLVVVFDVLRKNSLTLKLTKCAFNRPEVKFLGHVVSKDGIKVDPKKISAVMDWATPTDLSDLKKFLGLTN